MVAKKFAEDYILEIEKCGWSESRVRSAYFDKKMSKSQITVAINNSAGRSVIHRHALNKVFEHWGIVSRTREEQVSIGNAKREEKAYEKTYGNGYSPEDVVKLYRSGWSLARIYREAGVSQEASKRILKRFDVPVKRQVEYTDVIKKMQQRGIERDQVYDWYISQNLSQSELMSKISECTGFKVGRKSIAKILEHFSVDKPLHLVKQLQGEKSRRDKEYMLLRLREAGYSTPQDLSDAYQTGKYTYDSLVRELNARLGENIFTKRWMERHVAPLIPQESRRKNTWSRVENSVLEFIKDNYSGEIISRDTRLIHPHEIDIFLPDKKIAIEVNGDYWHSDRFLRKSRLMPAEDYHAMKSDLCAEKGVQIAYVWEWEWNNNYDKMSRALRVLLHDSIILPALMKTTGFFDKQTESTLGAYS